MKTVEGLFGQKYPLEGEAPKFKKVPKSYILVDIESRMSIAGCAAVHLQSQLAEHAPCLVFPHIHIDCPFCRERRSNLAACPGYADFFDRDEISYSRDSDTYWCNDCQGTGWYPEPWPLTIKRYKIVTWEDRARELSTTDLVKEIALGDASSFPHRILMQIAAEKLTEKFTEPS